MLIGPACGTTKLPHDLAHAGLNADLRQEYCLELAPQQLSGLISFRFIDQSVVSPQLLDPLVAPFLYACMMYGLILVLGDQVWLVGRTVVMDDDSGFKALTERQQTYLRLIHGLCAS